MIRIIVAGQPAPQGNHRVSAHGAIYESSKAVRPWREAIRGETQRAMTGREPLGGPVEVQITFRLARPKSHYRTGKNAHLLSAAAPAWPAKQPDLDKLTRAVLDGLTAGGAWGDDGQVCYLAVMKEYGQPGCLIEISEMP